MSTKEADNQLGLLKARATSLALVVSTASSVARKLNECQLAESLIETAF